MRVNGTTSGRGLAIIFTTLVACASCRLPLEESYRCDPNLITVTKDDPRFESGAARAVEAAKLSTSGDLLYFGGTSSVPESTFTLTLQWDETTVTGVYDTCDDGTEKWRDDFRVPVTARLSTGDELFSETLTGVVKKDPADLANSRLELDDIPLASLQGRFGWEQVAGWQSDSDVCEDATIRFGALILDSKTGAIRQREETPGFLNLQCPTEEPPEVPLFAVAGFK